MLLLSTQYYPHASIFDECIDEETIWWILLLNCRCEMLSQTFFDLFLLCNGRRQLHWLTRHRRIRRQCLSSRLMPAATFATYPPVAVVGWCVTVFLVLKFIFAFDRLPICPCNQLPPTQDALPISIKNMHSSRRIIIRSPPCWCPYNDKFAIRRKWHCRSKWGLVHSWGNISLWPNDLLSRGHSIP